LAKKVRVTLVLDYEYTGVFDDIDDISNEIEDQVADLAEGDLSVLDAGDCRFSLDKVVVESVEDI
jgi:hypothetical protein